MTPADALHRLGLEPGATPEEIKAAYREAARRLHPDVAADDPDNHRRMTEVNLAYARLSGAGPLPAPAPPGHPTEAFEADVVLDVDGTLLVAAPADETFDRLVDAAERVGDLTYVDRSAGLLQLLVRHELGPWCYVTFSLQGRAVATEIFTTIESIDGRPTPPVDDVLALVVDELRAAAP